MRIAVLCGGKGTRLGEPIKCLAEVAGRPFMDWKLEQLERLGASHITLCVGPFFDEFAARYGDRCTYKPDNQFGIADVVDNLPDHTYWTMGDVLLEQPLEWLAYPTMYVRRSDEPNIAGIYLDCGLYFGKQNFRLVETWAQPYHINTRADLEVCDEMLRGHRLAR
jgi:hypothetical protein